MQKIVDGVALEMTADEVAEREADMAAVPPPVPPARPTETEAVLIGLIAAGKLTEGEAATALAAAAAARS